MNAYANTYKKSLKTSAIFNVTIITVAILKISVLAFLAVTMNSCGKDNDNDEDADSALNNEHVLSEKAPHALVRNSLPECNADNENQLVYILDDEQFYTCASLEWVVIKLNLRTKPVYNTNVMQGNFWFDEMTGNRWYVYDFMKSGNECNGLPGDLDFLDLPKPDEIKAALRNGMFKGLNVPVWVEDDRYVMSEFPDSEVKATSKAFQLCKVINPK